MMADMYVRTVARPQLDLRGRRGARRPGRRRRRRRSVSAAKLLAGEAAIENARAARPDPRRHGLHLGDAAELPAQAGVGARARPSARRPRHAADHQRLAGGGGAVSDSATTSCASRRPTSVLRIVLDRPSAKNSLTRDRGAGDRSAPSRPPPSTTRCGRCSLSLERRRLLRRRRRRGQQPRRTAPSRGWATCNAAPRSQAHRLIEVLTHDPAPGGLRGARLGRRARLPARARRPTSPSPSDTARFWEPFCGRGFTPDSGATWLLPAARRRRPGQGAAAARPRGQRAPTPPTWGMIYRCVPDDGARRGIGGARRRPGRPGDDRPRPHQALHQRVAARAADRGHGQRGVRARAVVAHVGLPRRSGVVQGSPPPDYQGR